MVADKAQGAFFGAAGSDRLKSKLSIQQKLRREFLC